ncbi:MAG: carbamoyltransferase HypF, partial [Candidatus Omnitrophica bacterium]|nr:carbamoyltransferase HypF [Candidatus Omnitrophota bacterium]
FHNTLAAVITEVCILLKQKSRLRTVILSGGVFQNKILSEEAKARLLSAGFKVYLHSKVSAGDSGISLGQAVIAASRAEKIKCA